MLVHDGPRRHPRGCHGRLGDLFVGKQPGHPRVRHRDDGAQPHQAHEQRREREGQRAHDGPLGRGRGRERPRDGSRHGPRIDTQRHRTRVGCASLQLFPMGGTVLEHLAHPPGNVTTADGRHLHQEKRLQVLLEVTGRRAPPNWVPLERPHDDLVEFGGHRRVVGTRRHNLAVEHGMHAMQRGAPREQPTEGEHLPQHDPELEHVGARIGAATGQLLGRHVTHLAGDRARPRQARLVGPRRDAEVEQLDPAVVADHHVGRRHVAMHDGARPAGWAGTGVGERQRGGHLSPDVACNPYGNPMRGLLHRLEKKRHALPAQVLQHDVGAHLVAPDVEGAHDVRVTQRRGEPGLFEEPVGQQCVVVYPLENPLERDQLLEAPGALLQREMHGGHAADTNLGTDSKGPHRRS